MILRISPVLAPLIFKDIRPVSSIVSQRSILSPTSFFRSVSFDLSQFAWQATPKIEIGKAERLIIVAPGAAPHSRFFRKTRTPSA